MRLNYREVRPDALRAMLGLQRVADSGMDDPRLLDLVKLRASQINGCAHCVRLHAGEARERGETEERLDLLAVWREADCFGHAERAALAWCEALTLLSAVGAPDELYDELSTPLHVGADRRAHARDRRDQRLESTERRLPYASSRCDESPPPSGSLTVESNPWLPIITSSSAANPHHWPEAAMRTMMKSATPRPDNCRSGRSLAARYAAGDVASTARSAAHPRHRRMLCSGIIQRFPSRFRAATPPRLPDGRASRSSRAGGP